jgi:hypothetical protein
LRREDGVEDTSDGGGHDSEEEGGEEEKHEKEGHYKGEAMHFEDEMVGVTDMLQDPHPHVDIRLATSFALL